MVHGTISVSDINGALVTQVGGYPGQPLDELGLHQLKRMGKLLRSLKHGKTYACPGGAGGGYDDLVPGAQVVAQDGSGRILATSHLTGGTLGIRGCTFDWTLRVPQASFYQFTVSHRGALTYSLSELTRDDWTVEGSV